MRAGIFRDIASWSTNIAHLGLERFRALPMSLPPRDEQALIVREAAHRLTAIEAQVAAVRSSLSRLPEFEQELLAAAVAGKLSPQDPDDEPRPLSFSVWGRRKKRSRHSPHLRQKVTNMPSKKPRPSQQAEPTPDLEAV